MTFVGDTEGREARVFTCSCGKTSVRASGKPITTSICYCGSCQKGSRQIESLPGGHATAESDGGTRAVVYRKDRVDFSGAGGTLGPYKPTDDSATKRVVATCCNTGMYLDVPQGHWYTMYANTLEGDAPRFEMAVQTKDKPAGVSPPAGIPSTSGYSAKFMFRLIKAFVAMKLGR